MDNFKEMLTKISLQLEADKYGLRGNDDVCDFEEASLRLNLLYRHVTTEVLGLKGYKFFTMTYDLASTVRKISYYCYYLAEIYIFISRKLLLH